MLIEFGDAALAEDLVPAKPDCIYGPATRLHHEQASKQPSGVVPALSDQFIDRSEDGLILSRCNLTSLRGRRHRLDRFERISRAFITCEADAIVARPIPYCRTVGADQIVVSGLVLIRPKAFFRVGGVDFRYVFASQARFDHAADPFYAPFGVLGAKRSDMVFEIGAEYLVHCLRASVPFFLGDGITPQYDFAVVLLCSFTSLIDRDPTVATDRKPAHPTLWISINEDEGAEAARADQNAETGHDRIPIH